MQTAGRQGIVRNCRKKFHNYSGSCLNKKGSDCLNRKYIMSCLLFMGILFLTACGGKKKLSVDSLKESTILVRSDGSIEQYIMETFNKNYYKEEDLTSFAREKIDKYNDECGEKRIELLSVDVKKKKAYMLLEYESAEDYAEFNAVEASLITVGDAQEKGVLPETLYRQGKNTAVSLKEATLEEEWKVFFLAADTNIQTAGEIKYYQNAILLNQMTVQAEEDKTAVVIFK